VAVLANIFGTDSLYVLIIAVVVLFGGSQLPKLARNAGEAMKEFRKAHNEASAPLDSSGPTGSSSAASAMAPSPTILPAQPALPQVADPAPAPSAGSSDERVTLTRAELDALLADRERRARAGQGGNEN
jgi:sec-independent protein translocase protein TatA